MSVSTPKSVNAISLVTRPVDRDQAVFLVHFDGDVAQPVLVFAEHRDVVDLVDLGQAQAAAAVIAVQFDVSQFIEPLRPMRGDPGPRVDQPGLRIVAVDPLDCDRLPPKIRCGAISSDSYVVAKEAKRAQPSLAKPLVLLVEPTGIEPVTSTMPLYPKIKKIND